MSRTCPPSVLVTLCLWLILAPAFALAEPLDWIVNPVPGKPDHPLLYLWGTIATITGLKSAYEQINRFFTTDDVHKQSKPEKGISIGGNLFYWVNKLLNKPTDQRLHNQEIRELPYSSPTRLTPNSAYTLSAEDREDLLRSIGLLLKQSAAMSELHVRDFQSLHETMSRLQDIIALPHEDKIEDLLLATEDLVHFAKGMRRQFKIWYPQDTDETLDHIVQIIQDNFDHARDVLQEKDDMEISVANKNREIQTLMNQVGEWETLALLWPHTAATFSAVSRKIRDLMDRANPAPLLNLFQQPPSDTSLDNIADLIRQNLNKIEAAVQTICPQERLTDYHDIEDFILKTADFSKRATRYWKAMSGVTTTNSIITEADVQTLRDSIPDRFLPPTGAMSFKDIKKAFEEIDQERKNALARPIPSCQHPVHLARTLHFPDQTPWATSIQEVERLRTTPQPAPAAVATTPSESSLFKISDVPKFTSRSQYETYREALVRFFSAIITPPADLFGIALNRIIASWEAHDVRAAAAHWNIAPLLVRTVIDATTGLPVIDPTTGQPMVTQRTWEQVTAAFLAACDQKFQSVTIVEDNIRHLNNTRPTPGQTPMEFLFTFEASLATMNSAALRTNTPQITGTQITAQLLRVIPAAVRDQLRMQFSFSGQRLENLTVDQLREPLINVWTYLHGSKPEKKPSAKAAQRDSTNHLSPRRCGLQCSYDQPSPAVPQELRGGIYPDPRKDANGNRDNQQRNQLCQDRNVCESCRRPRNQHSGNAQFRPVQPFRQSQPRALPAPAPRYLLPAPEPRIETLPNSPVVTPLSL